MGICVADELKRLPVEALLRYVDRSNPEVAALAYHLEAELSRVEQTRGELHRIKTELWGDRR